MEGLFFILFVCWLLFVLWRMSTGRVEPAVTTSDSVPAFDDDDFWWHTDANASISASTTASTTTSAADTPTDDAPLITSPARPRPYRRSRVLESRPYGSVAHRASHRATQTKSLKRRSSPTPANGVSASRKAQTRLTLRKGTRTARKPQPNNP